MKTKNLILRCSVMFVLIIVTSCKKDSLQDAIIPENTAEENNPTAVNGTDGTDGATGATGAQGEQGPAGTDGQDGADGATGPQGPAGENGLDGADGQDGVTGPQGAQGEQGPAGADGQDGANGSTGPQGPAGPKGEDGIINILASQWIDNPAYGKKGLGTSFSIGGLQPYFNEDTLNSGLVMVYGRNVNGTAAVALPTIRDRSTTYSFWISDKVLKISISSTKAGIEISYDNFTHFRYVVIPIILSNKNERIDFQKMTYEEIIQHFGLDI